MLSALWPLAQPRGVKFVLNAGGLNPRGARDALVAAFKAKGWRARIAVVTGDSVTDRIDELRGGGQPLAHLDTGADIAQRARAAGVRQRLPGRAADRARRWTRAPTSCSPAAWPTPRCSSARWCTSSAGRWDDWRPPRAGPHRRPSAGVLGPGQRRQLRQRGRVGEQSRISATSATRSPRWREDGSAIITKAPGTGGRVNFDTVRQQLLYEVHNPHALLLARRGARHGHAAADRPGRRPRPRRRRDAACRAPTRSRSSPATRTAGWASTVIGFCWPDALAQGAGGGRLGQAVARRTAAWRMTSCASSISASTRSSARTRDSSQRRRAERSLAAHGDAHAGQARRRRLRPRLFPWMALSARPTWAASTASRRPASCSASGPRWSRARLVESRVDVSAAWRSA